MSDAETPQTYSSGTDGLRQAAADFNEANPAPPDEIVKPDIGATDGKAEDNEPRTIRQAAKELSDWKEARAKQAAEIDAALGQEAPAEAADSEAEPQQPSAPDPIEEHRREQTQRAQQQNTARAAQLQGTLQVIAASFEQEFPEIRGWADVQAMAHVDPDRYARIIAGVNSAQAAAHELTALHNHLEGEQTKAFTDWAARQDADVAAKIPELKDTTKAKALRESVLDTLEGFGIKASEAADLWNGRASIPLRDARMQKVLVAAAKWESAQKLNTERLRTPRPPVPAQRPGSPGVREAAVYRDEVAIAAERLARKPTSIQAAVAYHQAKRAAAER